MSLIVRVFLACGYGGRLPGPYLVDDIEARELARIETVNGPLLEPRLEVVPEQEGITRDVAAKETAELARVMFPPPDVDDLEIPEEFRANLAKLSTVNDSNDDEALP